MGRRIAIGLVLALLVAPSAWAQDLRKGLAALKRGDYATALREWRPLAEAGSPSAQYNLGHLYRLGKGVPQDITEAVKWYRKAAAQGHARAQYNFAYMYYKGLVVSQDYAEAMAWYHKAAAQGHAVAQLRAIGSRRT